MTSSPTGFRDHMDPNNKAAGRPFLILAAVAASFINPSVVSGQVDAVKDKPNLATDTSAAAFVGSGKHRFEFRSHWCQLAGKDSLGPTHGSVAVDANLMVYIALDAGKHGIAVHDKSGKFLRHMASDFVGTHHLICNKEGDTEFLYGAHLAGKRIFKMTLAGKLLWTITCPVESGKYDNPNSYRPTGIAVAPDGSVYVADGYGLNWIHQYDRNQKYVRSFGGRGQAEGQFRTCHSIALDPRGKTPRLLVCDRENRRLQYFDLDGKFLSIATTKLFRPCCLSFHGQFVAVAELAGRVSLLDGENRVVAVLGDNSDDGQRANYKVVKKDWKKNQFNAPHGLAFTPSGDLIVLEWNQTGRLVYLKASQHATNLKEKADATNLR